MLQHLMKHIIIFIPAVSTSGLKKTNDSSLIMVKYLISFSFRNRWLVLLFSIGLFVWGAYSVKKNPVDAIPDLSENQVIVFTEWMGRSPQVIEDQITYPLASNLQGIPKIKNIRATSMFGMSFVY